MYSKFVSTSNAFSFAINNWLSIQSKALERYIRATLPWSLVSRYFHFSIICIKHCSPLKALWKSHYSFKKILSKKGTFGYALIHKPFVHFAYIWKDTNGSIILFLSFIILFKYHPYVSILQCSWKKATW